jgi:hypothetical membrane protein
VGGVSAARTAAGIWLAGAAVYLISEAIAAASVPGYSYVADYISDLGSMAIMNIGAFVLHGTLFLAGAVVIARACPILGWAGWGFVLAAAANAIGNILVGTFRSGAAEATSHINWHVIGAGMAIMGGNTAVIIAGIVSRRFGAPRSYRRASVLIGVVGIGCLLVLVIDGVNGSRLLPVGVLERGSVYSIVVWEIMTAVAILCRRTSDFGVPSSAQRN